MKIAHRKAQAEAYKKPFRQAIFWWALTTNMFRRVPLRLSGVLGEIGLYVPKKGQAVDVVGELMPPTLLTFDAESVCVDSEDTPGKFLAEGEKPFPFRELPFVGASLLHCSSPF